MAVEVIASGSQAANVGSIHSLSTIAGSAYVLQAAIDVNGLANGSTPDLIIVRIWGKARSSDTARIIKTWSLIGDQSEDLWLSPPFISPHHFSLDIQQSQGTGRTFPWAIYKT